ncbi:MAG: hypothetical protein ACRCT1_18200 [Microcoleaceae cyanobacterium]
MSMYVTKLEKFVVVAVISFIAGNVFGPINSRPTSTSVIASPAPTPNYENLFNSRESLEKPECGKTVRNQIKNQI